MAGSKPIVGLDKTQKDIYNDTNPIRGFEIEGKWYHIDYEKGLYKPVGVRKYNSLNTPSEVFNERPVNAFKLGKNSHTEGVADDADKCAQGEGSHVEGNNTTAEGKYSHAEGADTIAKKDGSHSEGYKSTAEGIYSHAEGNDTTATGNASHAEGLSSKAKKSYSHAEGNNTTANGQQSHAEGINTQANGKNSHAEGDSTIASGENAHAEGKNTTASGNHSHAEGGEETKATSECAHAEGKNTTASGTSSHSEGERTKAKGERSHSEGNSTIASGANAHAEGQLVRASGINSHAEGGETSNKFDDGSYEDAYVNEDGQTRIWACQAIGNNSHAEGVNCKSNGTASHTQGSNCRATAMASHASGAYSKCASYGAHAMGYGVVVPENVTGAMAVGKWNQPSSEYLFVVGNGNGPSDVDFNNLWNWPDDDTTKRSNAFAVDVTGNVFCKGTKVHGNDYAEYFLWADGNPTQELRWQKFVSLVEDKIKIAEPGEDIIGVISTSPSITGDFKLTEGKDKSEYAPVGLLGKLIVEDNGECKVGARCICGHGGIAIPGSDYRVIKRLDNNHILILASFL